MIKSPVQILLINSFKFANNRKHRYIVTVASSFFSRGISMIAPLVTIPITLEYLGANLFGLWMTITSLLSMMVFADLGIGNGVLTEIGKLNGRADHQGIANLIFTSYVVLSGMSVIFLIFFYSIASVIPWGWIVHASDAALVGEARKIGLTCLTCFVIGIPLNLIAKIQLGLQRGYITEIWNIVSSLATMSCTLAAIHFRMPLSILVLTVTFTPLLFMLINTLIFFKSMASNIGPFVGRFDRSTMRTIVRIGSGFLILSLLTTIALGCDNLIISRIWGLKQVAEFEIASKPFKLVLLFVSLLLMPIWPAHAEAFARGDHSWIKAITRKLFLISTLVSVVMALAVWIASQTIFRFWIGPNFNVDRGIMSSLGLWTVLISIAGPYFMVLNGSGNIGVQIKMWACFLPLAVVCKIVFGHLLGLGGVPLGGSIPYLFIVIPWSMFYYNRVINTPPNHISTNLVDRTRT